ncbi:RsmB/NOP family class I SAM-dependent RNA methyltransferase [Candidatus Woesearchaeota archaeon]|nr:RsmB/NOP family class I SAM-dependent RNA methyltransferase [Candidatus Woesearchaeota archaeon]
MNTFLRRYLKLGEEFNPEDIAVKPSLRLNTLMSDRKDALKLLEKKGCTFRKIPFLEWGYWYESEFSLGSTTQYLLGYYYLQEAASQIPAQVLKPSKGDVVLDMACAPGSKLTQMAQYMENQGIIVGLDSNVKRLASVRNNCERLGITNTILIKKDARFCTDLGIQFDKVLLDAPCSGNFCVEPNFFSGKTLEGIKERAKLQRELLKAAVRVLKPKGTLVYSTCSLEPEENELNIHWLLGKYESLRLEKVDIPIGDPGLTEVFGEKLSPELKKCRRFWPHKTGTEGFFIAKISKKV